MLQVSQDAAKALENMRATEGIPPSHGLRVSGAQEPGGRVVINLAFVENPEPADQVIDQSGTEVYVAPEVAEPLSTAVMDVAHTGEAPEMVFRSQG